MPTLIRMLRRWWNDLRLPFKGLVISLLPLTALIVATGLLSYVIEMNDEAIGSIGVALEARSDIQTFRLALVKAESPMRSYLRTGLPADLHASLMAADALTDRLKKLESRLAGRPAQAVHQARLQTLVTEFISALRNELDAPALLGSSAFARKLLETVEALNNEVELMYGIENRTIAAESERQRRVHSSIEWLVWLNGWGGLTAGVIVTILFTTGITRRVYEAMANVNRIRSGRPLIPSREGLDEIARLASAIHESGEQLREQTKRLNLALEGTSVVIWELEPNARTLRFLGSQADRYKSSLGPEPDTLESWLLNVHRIDRTPALVAFEALITQDKPIELEVRWMQPDGAVRWQAVRGRCHENVDGGTKRYLGILFDITESKEAAERQQRAHEEASLARSQLSGVLEGAPDMIAALDLDFRFIAFNSAFRHWVGTVTQTELRLGMSLVDVFGRMPVEHATILGLWARALNGEEVAATEEFRDSKGGHRWYEITFGTIFDEQGRRIGATNIIRDITKQKQSTQLLASLAENLADSREELSKQVRILHSILSSMGDGLVVADENGKFLVFNPEAKAICGKGMTDVGVEGWAAEYSLFLPDGKTPCPPSDVPLARALRGEEVTSVELVIQPEGRSKTWISVTARPMRDETNRVRGGLVVFRDTTARKEMELQLTAAKERAEESNQMKSRFIAAVSHDLRTPLNSITGFSKLLAKEVAGPLNEQQRKYVNYVRDGSQHLLNLINDILDLSKVEAGKIDMHTEVFHFGDILPDVISTIQPLAAAKSIAVEFSIDGTEKVCADKTRIKQVLFNLLSNAVKFTPEQGRVQLTGASDGESVRIEVKDTGPGIPAGQERRIFEPFVQLSRRGSLREGSGLGLTISKRLIEMHGGAIEARNNPDGGCCVSFTIPNHQPVEAPVAALQRLESEILLEESAGQRE